MKAYSEYKAMNLPWLKAIPAHWEIRRNKNVYDYPVNSAIEVLNMGL